MSSKAFFSYDLDNKVVATADLVVPEPWLVLKSSKIKDRFFFYNKDTKQSAWSLEESVVIGIIDEPPPPQMFPPIKHEGPWPKNAAEQAEEGALFIVSSKSENIDSKQRGAEELGSPGKPRKNSFDPKKDPRPKPTVSERAIEPPAYIRSGSNGSKNNSQNFDKKSFKEKRRRKYRVTDGLGVGGFATVVKVEDTVSGYAYAMKVISKRRANAKENCDRLKLELNIMQTATASSPFLQHCYDAFENSANVFFVVELINGGDLFFHLTERLAESPNSQTGFQENEARVLLSEIYLGLEHLHAQGYVHRDVKIENIMINRSGHVKIVDYGLAVKLESEVQSMKAIGSVIYMAPELVSEHKGGRHTDWWAYGILAHELLTGRIPWSSLTNETVITREICLIQVAPPRSCSPVASQFISSLLRHKISSRLGTCSDIEIKRAKFFEDIDWEMTAQLQAPSAFIPGSICLAEPDRVASINMYNEVTANHYRDPPFTLDLESARHCLE